MSLICLFFTPVDKYVSNPCYNPIHTHTLKIPSLHWWKMCHFQICNNIFSFPERESCDAVYHTELNNLL